MNCIECEKPITGESVYYNDDFIVCKPCHDQVTADWEEDKKMLRAEGHKIPCDFIVALSEDAANTQPVAVDASSEPFSDDSDKDAVGVEGDNA